MANPSQPASHDVEQYLGTQTRGEAAATPIAGGESVKGKRSKKGVAAPHFGAQPTDSDLDGLLTEAEQALASVDAPSGAAQPAAAFAFRDLAGKPSSVESASLELIHEVELDLKIELGRTHMILDDVLKLRKGSVVPLDRLAGDPVDIVVNGQLIGRGEVLVMNDNFCVRVTELIS